MASLPPEARTPAPELEGPGIEALLALYDEAAAKMREANAGYLNEGSGYRANASAPAA